MKFVALLLSGSFSLSGRLCWGKLGQSAWRGLGLSSTPATSGKAGAERLEGAWVKLYTSSLGKCRGIHPVCFSCASGQHAGRKYRLPIFVRMDGPVPTDRSLRTGPYGQVPTDRSLRTGPYGCILAFPNHVGRRARRATAPHQVYQKQKPRFKRTGAFNLSSIVYKICLRSSSHSPQSCGRQSCGGLS